MKELVPVSDTHAINPPLNNAADLIPVQLKISIDVYLSAAVDQTAWWEIRRHYLASPGCRLHFLASRDVLWFFKRITGSSEGMMVHSKKNKWVISNCVFSFDKPLMVWKMGQYLGHSYTFRQVLTKCLESSRVYTTHHWWMYGQQHLCINSTKVHYVRTTYDRMF